MMGNDMYEQNDTNNEINLIKYY